MNSFEERLLNYLSTQEDSSEQEVRQHFRDDPELDEGLLKEYLAIISLSSNLRVYRQADLQDAWNKIVQDTDLAEEEAAEKIIADLEPGRQRVVTLKPTPEIPAISETPATPTASERIEAQETSTNGVGLHKESVVKPIAPKQHVNGVAPSEGKEPRVSRGNWWALAASMLLAIGTAVFFLTRAPYEETAALTDATVIYLPDNTKVTLAKGASIKFLKPAKFEKSRVREVFVKGDAIFDVVSDPARPFLVKSDLTQVQVLGTVFKFSAEGDFSAAENIEGQVDYQVLDGSNNAVLDPGDKASYDGKAFLVERFELPPPPPPPPPPANHVVAADLVDILSEKYPISLEMAPYMPYNYEVISLNMNEELKGLFAGLAENKDVEIDFSFRNGRYRLNKLMGKDIGLRSDYNYFDFVDGKPFKK